MINEKTVLKKLKLIIGEIIKESEISILEIEGGFILEIPVKYNQLADTGRMVKEERRQFVYVTYGRKTKDGKDLFQVFTICAPDNPEFYRNALFLNMDLPLGAFTISKVEIICENLKRKLLTIPSGAIPITEFEEKEYFVIVDTCLAKEANTKKIKTSVMSIAAAGDQLEKILVGMDIS